jgi:hypothetical protein
MKPVVFKLDDWVLQKNIIFTTKTKNWQMHSKDHLDDTKVQENGTALIRGKMQEWINWQTQIYW